MEDVQAENIPDKATSRGDRNCIAMTEHEASINGCCVNRNALAVDQCTCLKRTAALGNKSTCKCTADPENKRALHHALKRSNSFPNLRKLVTWNYVESISTRPRRSSSLSCVLSGLARCACELNSITHSQRSRTRCGKWASRRKGGPERTPNSEEQCATTSDENDLAYKDRSRNLPRKFRRKCKKLSKVDQPVLSLDLQSGSYPESLDSLPHQPSPENGRLCGIKHHAFMAKENERLKSVIAKLTMEKELEVQKGCHLQEVNRNLSDQLTESARTIETLKVEEKKMLRELGECMFRSDSLHNQVESIRLYLTIAEERNTGHAQAARANQKTSEEQHLAQDTAWAACDEGLPGYDHEDNESTGTPSQTASSPGTGEYKPVGTVVEVSAKRDSARLHSEQDLNCAEEEQELPRIDLEDGESIPEPKETQATPEHGGRLTGSSSLLSNSSENTDDGQEGFTQLSSPQVCTQPSPIQQAPTVTSSPPQVCTQTSSPPQAPTVTSSPPQVCTQTSSPPQAPTVTSSPPQVCTQASSLPQAPTVTSSPPQVCTQTSSPSVCTQPSSQQQVNTVTQPICEETKSHLKEDHLFEDSSTSGKEVNHAHDRQPQPTNGGDSTSRDPQPDDSHDDQQREMQAQTGQPKYALDISHSEEVILGDRNIINKYDEDDSDSEEYDSVDGGPGFDNNDSDDRPANGHRENVDDSSGASADPGHDGASKYNIRATDIGLSVIGDDSTFNRGKQTQRPRNQERSPPDPPPETTAQGAKYSVDLQGCDDMVVGDRSKVTIGVKSRTCGSQMAVTAGRDIVDSRPVRDYPVGPTSSKYNVTVRNAGQAVIGDNSNVTVMKPKPKPRRNVPNRARSNPADHIPLEETREGKTRHASEKDSSPYASVSEDTEGSEFDPVGSIVQHTGITDASLGPSSGDFSDSGQQFGMFLKYLAKRLVSRDVERMKAVLRPKLDMRHVHSPKEMLDCFKGEGLLREEDLDFLKNCLLILQREDIIRDLENYQRRFRDKRALKIRTFHAFLEGLASAMTAHDLQGLQHFLRLEQDRARTPLDALKLLESRQIIGPDDMEYLRKAFLTIKRHDLAMQITKFLENSSEHAPSQQNLIFSQPTNAQRQQELVSSQPTSVRRQQNPVFSEPTHAQRPQNLIFSEPTHMQKQQNPIFSQPTHAQTQHNPIFSQPTHAQTQQNLIFSQPTHAQRQQEVVSNQPTPVQRPQNPIFSQPTHAHRQFNPIFSQPTHAHRQFNPIFSQPTHAQTQQNRIFSQPMHAQTQQNPIFSQPAHAHRQQYSIFSQADHAQTPQNQIFSELMHAQGQQNPIFSQPSAHEQRQFNPVFSQADHAQRQETPVLTQGEHAQIPPASQDGRLADGRSASKAVGNTAEQVGQEGCAQGGDAAARRSLSPGDLVADSDMRVMSPVTERQRPSSEGNEDPVQYLFEWGRLRSNLPPDREMDPLSEDYPLCDSFRNYASYLYAQDRPSPRARQTSMNREAVSLLNRSISREERVRETQELQAPRGAYSLAALERPPQEQVEYVNEGRTRKHRVVTSDGQEVTWDSDISDHEESRLVRIAGARLEQMNKEKEAAKKEAAEKNDDPNRIPFNCSHYRRNCDVFFPCCNKFFKCHRCHNDEEKCEEKLGAKDATRIKCKTCGHEEEISEKSQYCGNPECGVMLAEYFCAICKHMAGNEIDPGHCEKCGICRTNITKSFHCDVCGVCLDNKLKGKHICRPDSAHEDCCICFEDAFSGCQILPCSHKVHAACATLMLRNGVTKCPVCRRSLFC